MILIEEELPSSASTGVYVGSNHNMVYGNGYFCFRPMKFLEPICMLSFYYKFKDNRGRRAASLTPFLYVHEKNALTIAPASAFSSTDTNFTNHGSPNLTQPFLIIHKGNNQELFHHGHQVRRHRQGSKG